MASKITLFINQGQQGFTETFYSQVSASSWAWGNAGAVAWLIARAGMLAPGGAIYGARVSQVGSPRQGYFTPFYSAYSSTIPAGAPADTNPAIVSSDVQLALSDSTLIYKRNFWLRGVPSHFVFRNAGGFPVFDATSRMLIQTWWNATIALALQIEYQEVPPNGGTFANQVLSAAAHATNPNWTTLTLLNVPVFTVTPATTARFTGVPKDKLPGFPRLATVRAISSVAPFSVTVSYAYRGQNLITSPAKMIAINLVYNYATLNLYQLRRVSDHKTGRPFGTLRGRVRAAVLAE